MILTVKELAEYLRIKPVTVYKLIKEKRVPFVKLGSTYRFYKPKVNTWLKQEQLKLKTARKEFELL